MIISFSGKHEPKQQESIIIQTSPDFFMRFTIPDAYTRAINRRPFGSVRLVAVVGWCAPVRSRISGLFFKHKNRMNIVCFASIRLF